METQFEQPARYYIVKSNFEATDAGWAFWRRFRKSNIADYAADLIFDDTNDLVVDTGSMDSLVAETRESTAADSRCSGAGSWRRAIPSRMEHHDRRSPLQHPRLLPPAHLLAKLGYPLVRRLQKRFGRESAARMQTLTSA
jgi:hypothetical protein